MLQQQVARFTNPGSTAWNGLPTTCLFAVTYWMLQELGVNPTIGIFVKISDLNTLFLTITTRGHRLFAPNIMAGNAHLPDGAVIVFANPAGTNASHACVVKQGLTVGGYNQMDWFATAGALLQYSEHDLGTDLRWVARSWPRSDRRAQGAHASEEYLYATPQAAALAELSNVL